MSETFFPFKGKPGTEAVVLTIDGIHTYVRKGWFFYRSHMVEDGITYEPYKADVEKFVPNWKTWKAESWYYIDGWKKRTAACGEVRL